MFSPAQLVKKTKIKVDFVTQLCSPCSQGKQRQFLPLNKRSKSFLDVSGLLLDGCGFLPKIWAELLLLLPAVHLSERRAQ